MKRLVKTAAEYDVISSWRHLYCYLDRPGVTAKIKRQMRRRERREAKREIRRERWLS